MQRWSTSGVHEDGRGKRRSQASQAANGRQVIVTVAKRGYKDKASGEQRWANDLTDVQPYA